MSTFAQIKKIHTLKNVLQLDDDLYLDMLMSFGVQSSKDLTTTEAGIFLEILEEKAVLTTKWEVRNKKYEELKSIIGVENYLDNSQQTPEETLGNLIDTIEQHIST